MRIKDRTISTLPTTAKEDEEDSDAFFSAWETRPDSYEEKRVLPATRSIVTPTSKEPPPVVITTAIKRTQDRKRQPPIRTKPIKPSVNLIKPLEPAPEPPVTATNHAPAQEQTFSLYTTTSSMWQSSSVPTILANKPPRFALAPMATKTVELTVHRSAKPSVFTLNNLPTSSYSIGFLLPSVADVMPNLDRFLRTRCEADAILAAQHQNQTKPRHPESTKRTVQHMQPLQAPVSTSRDPLASTNGGI